MLGEFSLDGLFRSTGILVGNLLHILKIFVVLWAPIFSHLFFQLSLLWWFIFLDLHFDILSLLPKFFLLFFNLFKFHLHFSFGVFGLSLLFCWFLFSILNWLTILVIRISFICGLRFLLCNNLLLLRWSNNICLVILI